MPWNPEDALKHTSRADSPARQRQWAYIANSILKRTGDERRAIRGASEQLALHPSNKKDPPKKAPKHWSGR